MHWFIQGVYDKWSEINPHSHFIKVFKIITCTVNAVLKKIKIENSHQCNIMMTWILLWLCITGLYEIHVNLKLSAKCSHILISFKVSISYKLFSWNLKFWITTWLNFCNFSEKVLELAERCGFDRSQSQCEYVQRETVNKKEDLCVPRIFVQGKFLKPKSS